MKKQQVVLIGGGGHCISVIEAIESSGKYEIAGIVDPQLSNSDKVLSYPVLGDDSILPALKEKEYDFHITVGQINSPKIRERIYNSIRSIKGGLVNVFASTSYVSPHATIGKGSTFLHRSFVNACASIGNNCIINTGALIEHEAIVGDHCHISTYAKINGQVKIGNRVFIGSNAVIFNNITIGDDVLIGAGAVIAKDVKPGSKIIAPPPKYLK